MVYSNAAREKIKRQANICQSEQHFVWAAILWRRLGKDDMADYCEWVATFKAESETPDFIP